MKYDTNLASEYYILSTLYRKGFEAFITLGNKKSIDILVKYNEELITIDVKGIIGTTSFPIDNFDSSIKGKNHFLVFISFLKNIADTKVLPEIYVIPSDLIDQMLYTNPKGNRKVVSLSKLRKEYKQFQDNWGTLTNYNKIKN